MSPEDSITQLESLRSHCEHMIYHDSKKRDKWFNNINAINVAISALRELKGDKADEQKHRPDTSVS